MREWVAFVALMDEVLADEALLPQVVAGVRGMVQEVASLPVADMAGHTRAMLTAATRALAGRRGPTEAELAFVEELAVTRASQGIPIEVVLGAVHVAERAVWARARDEAEARGVSSDVFLDARELYDDWAGEVRARLIRAHRETQAAVGGAARDRQAELLRRLLEGGSAAVLAAAEVGLPSSGVWVLLTRTDAGRGAQRLLTSTGGGRAAQVQAQIDDAVIAVTSSAPPARAVGSTAAVIALAGPVGPEEVGAAHRLALATVPAAEALGRSGLVHVAEVAGVTALLGRPDLARVLMSRHSEVRGRLGPAFGPVIETVRAWVENERDAEATGAALFVHPNTVRNRVQKFAEVTAMDPHGVVGAMESWWLCRSWMEEGL